MSHSNENVPALARLDELDRFCRAVFLAAGTDDETADAATRAMIHGTRLGVDSHGVRLLAHYVTALEGGRLNPRPQISRVSGFGAVETVDADNAHGARATYAAMENAMALKIWHRRGGDQEFLAFRTGWGLCAGGGPAGLYRPGILQFGQFRAPA